MRQIICDKCGAIIEGTPWKIVTCKNSISGRIDSELEKADYCDDCMEDIKEYIAKKGKKKPSATRPKKLTEDQKGTIGALWKAGWEAKEIAADVGVSLASVYNVAKELNLTK